MRFVRAWTRADNGEVVHLAEQELPFGPGTSLVVRGVDFEVEMHELGLVDDFEPTTIDGDPCPPSLHLFQRIERDPATADHAAEDLTYAPMTRFRARDGYELPEFMDVPTTIGGCQARLRSGGSLHPKARAWIAFMMPPEIAHSLDAWRGIPISVLKSLDSMRSRRDPSYGSQRIVFERYAQQQSDAIAGVRQLARLRALMPDWMPSFTRKEELHNALHEGAMRYLELERKARAAGKAQEGPSP